LALSELLDSIWHSHALYLSAQVLTFLRYRQASTVAS
jgi:hypothetical protein